MIPPEADLAAVWWECASCRVFWQDDYGVSPCWLCGGDGRQRLPVRFSGAHHVNFATTRLGRSEVSP